MKKVLITGARSYIGTSVEKWLNKWPTDYQIDTIDMIDGSWRDKDFSSYDVVYHVAGIAHVSSNKKMVPLYFKINRDLAIETAKKAKREGVKQFIFMSSMIIYGKDNHLGNSSSVDIFKYDPLNAYGQSKLEADLAIQSLDDASFRVVISRTPVVYGSGCKGNFPKLMKIAVAFPIFPKIDNQRSMIYIDNLCEFIRLIIEHSESGVFYPQNKEFVNTRDIIKLSRKKHGKGTLETKLFNWLFLLFARLFPIINKVYGNKTYDMKVSNYLNHQYAIVSLEQSIQEIKE